MKLLNISRIVRTIALKNSVFKLCRLDKEEIRADYTRAIEELALVKGVPLSSIESKRRSRASNDHIDIDSSKSSSKSNESTVDLLNHI